MLRIAVQAAKSQLFRVSCKQRLQVVRRKAARFGAGEGVNPPLLPGPSRSAPCPSGCKEACDVGCGQSRPDTPAFSPAAWPTPIRKCSAPSQDELNRQRDKIELIASENIVSKAVLEAQGSVLTNKYAEGYPGKRYYGGCEYVDVIETLAIERAKQAVRLPASPMSSPIPAARCQPGGVPGAAQSRRHLHGPGPGGGRPSHPRPSPVNYVAANGSSRCPIRVRRDDQRIDMDEIAALAREHKPKLIIAGGTAYSRIIDFAALPRDRRRSGRLS